MPFEELQRSLQEIDGDPRCGTLLDYLAVTGHDISAEQLRSHAALHIGAAVSNPNIVMWR